MELEVLKLAGALKSVLFAASTDPERPHLHAVQFTHRGDILALHATNGHWAAMWSDAVPEEGDAWVTMPMVDAKFLLSMLTLTDCDRIDIDVASCVFQTRKWRFQASLVDQGPDIKAIFDGRENGKLGAFAVNPDYVRGAAQAFKAAIGARNVSVEIACGPTETSPLLLTCSAAPEVAVLVMPMRLGADGDNAEQEKADVDKQRTIEDAIAKAAP